MHRPHKRARLRIIDYDMSVPDILRNHMDDINPKNLRKECLKTGDGKKLSVLVFYLLTKNNSISFISEYLPHYFFEEALVYLSGREREFAQHGMLAMFHRAITEMKMLYQSMHDDVTREVRERKKRISPLTTRPICPKIHIDLGHGHEGNAVIDSGADGCIMSYSKAIECGLLGRIDGLQRPTTRGIVGETASIGTISSLKLRIIDSETSEPRDFYTDVTIQRTFSDYLILLGQTFFQLYGCVLETRRPEDINGGEIHKVQFTVSSSSPTKRNGLPCTPQII